MLALEEIEDILETIGKTLVCRYLLSEEYLVLIEMNAFALGPSISFQFPFTFSPNLSVDSTPLPYLPWR